MFWVKYMDCQLFLCNDTIWLTIWGTLCFLPDSSCVKLILELWTLSGSILLNRGWACTFHRSEAKADVLYCSFCSQCRTIFQGNEDSRLHPHQVPVWTVGDRLTMRPGFLSYLTWLNAINVLHLMYCRWTCLSLAQTI